MKLRQLAHCRSGDKGNLLNISVITLNEEDYPFLVEHVTPMRVAQHFGDLVRGHVVRYECPLIGALNFVLNDALRGGVPDHWRWMPTASLSAPCC